MDRDNKILNLIAKLMSEESVCISQTKKDYIEFKKYYTDEYVHCLDDGGYNDNASVVSKLNDVCEEIEFFDVVPCLLGKHYINIHNSVEETLECLQEICEVSDVIKSIDNIPVMFVDNDESDEIGYFALSGTNKFIEIFDDEVDLFNDLQDYNIEKRKLVQLFIVKLKMKVKNVCLCFWPEKMLDVKYEKFFCSEYENYLIVKSVNGLKRRLLSQKREKICVLAPDELHESIILGLSDNQRRQIKDIKSSKSLLGIINNSDAIIDNSVVLNRIQNIILDVEIYYRNMIRRCKSVEKVMIEDLVHLPDGEVKDSISSRMGTIKKRKQFYEDLSRRYYDVCEELIKYLRIYQNSRKKELCNTNTVPDMYYDKVLETIFFKLISIDEYKRANDCLVCMRNMKCENIVIYELFFDYYSGFELQYEKVLELKSISTCNESIARVKIALGEIAEYSYAELESFSAYITNPIFDNELYILGKRYLKDSNYYEAAKCFKKAYEHGVEDAGQKLLLLALEYEEESGISLEDLTKMMIPEANYYMGLDLWEKGDEQAALVNLKISAAKKHFDSIEFIAEMLFESCKELSYKDMRDKNNQANVINIINLYEYLMHIAPKEQYQLCIGLMYCKLSDFKRAYEYLKSIDEPEAYYECALIYENGMGVAKNLKKAREYFRKCGNYKDASVQVAKISELLRRERSMTDYSNSQNNYGEEREVVSVERSGFCFITTAACIALHEHKNCEALNILRKFRDDYISDGDIGDLLIKEYYRIGPSIVAEIDKEWNPNAIYMQLWDYYIAPSCDEISKSNFDKAKNIYIDMVKRLCEKYKIHVAERICNLYGINYN